MVGRAPLALALLLAQCAPASAGEAAQAAASLKSQTCTAAAVASAMLDSVAVSAHSAGLALTVVSAVLVGLPLCLVAGLAVAGTPRLGAEEPVYVSHSDIPDQREPERWAPAPAASRRPRSSRSPGRPLRRAAGPTAGAGEKASELHVPAPLAPLAPPPPSNFEESSVPLASARWPSAEPTSRSVGSKGWSEVCAEAGAWPLCPGLVVSQPGGATLAVLALRPGFQRRREAVEVRRADGSREVMARAVASRGGADVVVESSLRMPVVSLRLQRGPAPEGAGVAVLRATPSAGPTAADALPLCTIRADGAGEGFVAWCGAAADRAVLLALRLHGGDGGPANVVDGEGRLLSAVESLSGDAGQSLQLLHVAQGVDSTLIIAAVVAAQMLRDA